MDSVWLGIYKNLAQMHHDAIMHVCVYKMFEARGDQLQTCPIWSRAASALVAVQLIAGVLFTFIEPVYSWVSGVEIADSIVLRILLVVIRCFVWGGDGRALAMYIRAQFAPRSIFVTILCRRFACVYVEMANLLLFMGRRMFSNSRR